MPDASAPAMPIVTSSQGSPRLVVIESPYAGEVARNVRYARACLLDSLRRGEAPIASHLLYTQVLDDCLPPDRQLGIAAGLAWGRYASLVAFYVDLGWSSGMRAARAHWLTHGIQLESRNLPRTILSSLVH